MGKGRLSYQERKRRAIPSGSHFRGKNFHRVGGERGCPGGKEETDQQEGGDAESGKADEAGAFAAVAEEDDSRQQRGGGHPARGQGGKSAGNAGRGEG